MSAPPMWLEQIRLHEHTKTEGALLDLIEQMGEALIVEMALNGGHDEGCSCISCAALAAYEQGPTP